MLNNGKSKVIGAPTEDITFKFLEKYQNFFHRNFKDK